MTEIYDIFCVAVVSLHIGAESVWHGDIVGDRATGPVRVDVRAAVGTGEIHHLSVVLARFGGKNYALRAVFLRNLAQFLCANFKRLIPARLFKFALAALAYANEWLNEPLIVVELIDARSAASADGGFVCKPVVALDESAATVFDGHLDRTARGAHLADAGDFLFRPAGDRASV